ncbi:MAG: sirohydrochlorin cobaltochelatase [Anaerovoracaceae bacterium]
MSKTKAILIVSFGTSFKETREKTIDAIEKEIAREFKNFQVRKAFTSERIINSIQKKENVTIDNVKSAMAKLYEEGIEEVYVQPTHVINGVEYEKILKQLADFEDKFNIITVGKPLLSSQKDFRQACAAIIDRTRHINKEEVLLLMGHGTDNNGDLAYLKLEEIFESMGYGNYLVATVEGNMRIENIIPRLKAIRPTTIYLMPFMVVAGEHVKNDMCGEGENSWKNILEKQGFRVKVIDEGLGENIQVRKVYKNHINDCLGGCKLFQKKV